MAAGNRFGPVCGHGRELDGARVGLGRREWLLVNVDIGEYEHEHEHVNEHEDAYVYAQVYARRRQRPGPSPTTFTWARRPGTAANQ